MYGVIQKSCPIIYFKTSDNIAVCSCDLLFKEVLIKQFNIEFKAG